MYGSPGKGKSSAGVDFSKLATPIVRPPRGPAPFYFPQKVAPKQSFGTPERVKSSRRRDHDDRWTRNVRRRIWDKTG